MTDTTKSGSPLDRSTKKILARVANQINYKQRNYTDDPITTILFEEDIPHSKLEKTKIKERLVTVIEFECGDSARDSPLTGNEEEGIVWYAVDWPLKKDSGKITYLTFFFTERPSKLDIINARLITRMMTEIELGEIEQTYICDECHNQVHWTDVIEGQPSKTTLEKGFKKMKLKSCPSCDKQVKKHTPLIVKTEYQPQKEPLPGNSNSGNGGND